MSRQAKTSAEGRDLTDADDGKDKVLGFEVNDEEFGWGPDRPVELSPSAPER